jgi:hypothetical protein
VAPQVNLAGNLVPGALRGSHERAGGGVGNYSPVAPSVH